MLNVIRIDGVFALTGNRDDGTNIRRIGLLYEHRGFGIAKYDYVGVTRHWYILRKYPQQLKFRRALLPTISFERR